MTMRTSSVVLSALELANVSLYISNPCPDMATQPEYEIDIIRGTGRLADRCTPGGK